MLIPQNRHFDLAGIDTLLGQNQQVKSQGFFQMPPELLGAAALADSDGRTHVGRLYEHGVGELFLDLRHNPVGGLFPSRFGRAHERQDRQSGAGKHLFAPDFVHGQRRGQHSGSHVGQAQHLQRPLHGSVLAERSVQHREHDVQRSWQAGQNHKPVLPTRWKLPRPLRRKLQLPAQDLGIVTSPLPVQTHDRDSESSRVQVVQNRSGRDEGNVMLGGASSAEDRHVNPAVCHGR